MSGAFFPVLAILVTAMTATACQSVLGIEQKSPPEVDASAGDSGNVPQDGGSTLVDARAGASDGRVVE